MVDVATNLTILTSPASGDSTLRAQAFSVFSYGDAFVLIAWGFFTVLVFMAGVFFGAFLQRRVAYGQGIDVPTFGKTRVVEEPDEERQYEHPSRGYEF